ncbi:hypothetical protein [Runella sp.]|jgi:hypothetical protein|uniref:hypothetical protein n=1 Tax=Runella sp. TaxID=1960881 RepID=UPI00260DC02E|nr:hypothetical protein [Runella sp.]
MSQAHALYELYKHLPEKAKKQFKQLVEKNELVEVPIEALEKGLQEVKLIQQGKLPRRTFADLKREMANEK